MVNLARGLISSVDIIVGQQDYLESVEFKLEDSTEVLERNIKKKSSKYGRLQWYIVFNRCCWRHTF